MAISVIGGAAASSSGIGATEFGGLGVIAGGFSSTGQATVTNARRGTFYLSHDRTNQGRCVLDYGAAGNVVNSHFNVVGGQSYGVTYSSPVLANAVVTSANVYSYWNLNTTPTATLAAAFGAGLYVYGDSSGVIYSSPDLVTWTSRHTMGAVITRAITWTGTQFIATGSNAGGGTGIISTSPDGITWTIRTTPATNNRDIAFGAGIAVSASTSGLHSSPDFTTWTSRNANQFTSVAHNGLAVGSGSMFVAVSAAGIILTSPDGTNWTSRGNPGATWQSVAFGNGVWVAVGQNGQIASSSDAGVTWPLRVTTTYFSGTVRDFFSVAFSGGRFVAASSALVSADPGGGGFHTSTDGITWRPAGGTANPATADQPRYLSTGNSRFLCSNQAGSLSWSLDGIAGQPNSFALMSSGYQTLN